MRRTPISDPQPRLRLTEARVERNWSQQDVADRIEVGAAVMGHHALGITRGARGVAQRNRVPLVAG